VLTLDCRFRLLVLLQPVHAEGVEGFRIPKRHFLVVHELVWVSSSPGTRKGMGSRAALALDPQLVSRLSTTGYETDSQPG